MKIQALFPLVWMVLVLADIRASFSVDSSESFLPSESDFPASLLMDASNRADTGSPVRGQRLRAKEVAKKSDAPSSLAEHVDSVEHVMAPEKPLPLSGAALGAPFSLRPHQAALNASAKLNANASYTHEGMKERVGRATWTLLHTIAAEYPDPLPTAEYQERLQSWLQLLPSVYPCEECAAHMKTMFERFPPKTENQTVFGEWVCQIHNIVNDRLSKPKFDCATWRQTWVPLADCHASCKSKSGEEPW